MIRLFRNNLLNVFTYHSYSLLISATFWYDNISISLGWLNKLLVHRLEHLTVSVNDHLHISSTLHNITGNVADKSLVSIRINEYLNIHHITQTLVKQCHYALNDDNRLRLYMNGCLLPVTFYI